MNEGWTYLYNSPKWHYFRDGRSLCGKWMTFSKELERREIDSPDNCVACKKKRDKELAKEHANEHN